jgi:hypothetical protein
VDPYADDARREVLCERSDEFELQMLEARHHLRAPALISTIAALAALSAPLAASASPSVSDVRTVSRNAPGQSAPGSRLWGSRYNGRTFSGDRATAIGASPDGRRVPIRLVENDGGLYTLDNRRLVAFGDAGVAVPYRMASASEIAREWDTKFTTKTGGLSIQLRLW